MFFKPEWSRNLSSKNFVGISLLLHEDPRSKLTVKDSGLLAALIFPENENFLNKDVRDGEVFGIGLAISNMYCVLFSIRLLYAKK